MNIEFDNKKSCECYKNFVENPVDRTYTRKFFKEFGQQLASPAVKLHERLKSYESVSDYNKIYNNDNRIEIKKGSKENERIIFKVRVQGAFRKFFCHVIEDEFFIKKDWCGNFESVTDIYVIDVNNHDYSVS